MTATSTAPAKINVLHQADGNINLVLIHGVYHGSWAIDEIWPAWRQLGYGIYSVDLRGRGANEGLKSSDPIGYKEHLQDTKNLLDNLSGNKIVNGSLCQIPEAGHDFMIEKRSADYCAKQITNWLNESNFLS